MNKGLSISIKLNIGH